MKKSLTRQMILIFVGILLGTIILSILFIRLFLPQYYFSRKQKAIISAYEQLNLAIDDDSNTQEDLQSLADRLSERDNIAIYAIDSTGNEMISSTSNAGLLKNRIFSLAFQLTEDTIIEEEDRYQLLRSQDMSQQGEFLELWGYLSNDCLFIMRTPIESLQESAAVASKFLLIVTILAGVLGSVFILFFCRRITKPIKELTKLSSSMADLDFNVHYESGGENEIGMLGENFNRMSHSLEQTISELKEANLSLHQDIEKKKKLEVMRSDFVSNVSHELKTPIALISGYAEGLLDEDVLESKEERTYYAEVIADEAKKMNQMIRNMLTLSQLEFGSEKLSFSRFNISELIQGVLSSHKPMFEESGITCDANLDICCPVWGDEFLIEEVFTNYLNNAIHHCSGNKQIQISVEAQDEKAHISVYNTGEPIPDETRERIWEKFYKADKARTREYGGNGIGLSIVKAIMEAHNESYGCENQKDGVLFWFELDMSTRGDKNDCID